PAGAAGPCARGGRREAQARRARGAHPLRRRRRDLHRRSLLHQAVRLPVADGQAQSRSAAHRSGRDCDRELRRLRPVRRGGARSRAVSIVLSCRAHSQPAYRRAVHVLAAPPGHRLARRTRGGGVMSAPARPFSILIAALGGEGGGVLAGWIVAAADELDFPVQSTSIPGVAQRTGATTYYIEMLPASQREVAGRRPVLSLVPGVGDIDLLAASALMEAARMAPPA